MSKKIEKLDPTSTMFTGYAPDVLLVVKINEIIDILNSRKDKKGGEE